MLDVGLGDGVLSFELDTELVAGESVDRGGKTVDADLVASVVGSSAFMIIIKPVITSNSPLITRANFVLLRHTERIGLLKRSLIMSVIPGIMSIKKKIPRISKPVPAEKLTLMMDLPCSYYIVFPHQKHNFEKQANGWR